MQIFRIFRVEQMSANFVQRGRFPECVRSVSFGTGQRKRCIHCNILKCKPRCFYIVDNCNVLLKYLCILEYNLPVSS